MQTGHEFLVDQAHDAQHIAAELVGRFVPTSDWPDWDLELLAREAQLLDPTTRSIVGPSFAGAAPASSESDSELELAQESDSE